MKVFVPFCESLLGSALGQDAVNELVPFSHHYACLRAMRAEIISPDGQALPVSVPDSKAAIDRLLEDSSVGLMAAKPRQPYLQSQQSQQNHSREKRHLRLAVAGA